MRLIPMAWIEKGDRCGLGQFTIADPDIALYVRQHGRRIRLRRGVDFGVGDDGMVTFLRAIPMDDARVSA